METIVDFKQANRPKKEEWIEDYYLQIAMYAMAHDYVYGSQIKQGVIMVCTPDYIIKNSKHKALSLRAWKHKALKRIDMYNELMHDEKERTTPMKAEDFNDGSNEVGIHEVQTRNKAISILKYRRDLVAMNAMETVKRYKL